MLVQLLHLVLLFGNLKRPAKGAKDMKGQGEGSWQIDIMGPGPRTVEFQAKLAIMGVMATPG